MLFIGNQRTKNRHIFQFVEVFHTEVHPYKVYNFHAYTRIQTNTTLFFGKVFLAMVSL